MTALSLRFAALAAALLIAAQPARAQSTPAIQPFLGVYAGQTVFASDAGYSKRDMNVMIEREGQGFLLEWTTVTQKANGKDKTKTHTVAFQPSGRPGIYQPVGKIDRFGNKVPLEPLKGDPQVWARIEGKTLSVYATVITEDGGVEMQTYDRTLVPGGMDLHFTRIRNGRPLKEIKARLEIQDPKTRLPYPECLKLGECKE